MNNAVVYIGVDVAKASLDVAWAEHSRRFANNKSGLGALTKWVKQSRLAVHLICEASRGLRAGIARCGPADWDQSQFGTGQSGAAICPCGWHLG